MIFAAASRNLRQMHTTPTDLVEARTPSIALQALRVDFLYIKNSDKSKLVSHKAILG